MGRSLSTKVAAIIHNGGWQWPRPRCVLSERVANTDPSLVPNPSVPDSMRWILCKFGLYSV